MKQFLEAVLKELRQGHPVVWASILESSGSTPRSSGARMMVRTDGSIVGTIGGGIVEAECQKEGVRALERGTSCIREYDLTNDAAAGLGMICGGRLSVLLDVLLPEGSVLAQCEELLQGLERGGRLMRVTRVNKTSLGESGDVAIRHLVINKSASHADLLPLEVISRGVRTRDPFTVQEGETLFLVEPAASRGMLYIIGAGHVSYFTAKVASMTGFSTVVMDDRDEFANRERFPDVHEVRVLDDFSDCFGRDEMGEDSYIVIVTRGHQADREVLAQALRTPAGYIGMIGSKKKREATYASLLQDGFAQADIDRVYSPIGLSIGADTPEEIAVSIVGELIAVRAGKV
ncbi:MAG: XdhC family aldehyde oxidoreductase maturation factor [Desulfovibrio sp.]|uniref:XdhC family aldehyde oxidoreductase maturation factor n=1 Tax=Desulfovibrio sp. 7SRBS1 TaxID=3378064 RepID=UPI003B3DDBC2